MNNIPYANEYRDDMIFMVLEAKNALGRIPHLNEDLLNIQKHFLLCGDMFWLAISNDNRVIGCIGYHKYNQNTAKIQRLYVKCSMKRQGIGTKLLHTAEQHIKKAGYQYSIVHLGGKEYFESKQFYPKHGYTEYTPSYMYKKL